MDTETRHIYECPVDDTIAYCDGDCDNCERDNKVVLTIDDLFEKDTFKEDGIELEKTVAKTDKNDKVNHPSHYTYGKYEVIDIIEDSLSTEQFKGFLYGNIMKYILRCQHKNGLEDLKKAKWYLERLIKIEEEEYGFKS